MTQYRMCIQCGRGTWTPVLQRWCVECVFWVPLTTRDKAATELYHKTILLDHIPGARYEIWQKGGLRHVKPINKNAE